jgi:hypothetical protein
LKLKTAKHRLLGFVFPFFFSYFKIDRRRHADFEAGTFEHLGDKIAGRRLAFRPNYPDYENSSGRKTVNQGAQKSEQPMIQAKNPRRN